MYGTIWSDYFNSGKALVYTPVPADATAPHLAVFAPVDEYHLNTGTDPRTDTDPNKPAQCNNDIPKEVNNYGLVSRTNVTTLVKSASAEPSSEQNSIDVEARISLALLPIQDEAEGASNPRRTLGGAEFGTVVHRSIYLCLVAGISAEAAVPAAIAELNAPFAAHDILPVVAGALGQLKAKGYLDGGWTVFAEIPFASVLEVQDRQMMLTGAMDLLLVRGEEAVIIDYKTDLRISAETQEKYEAQLAMYQKVLLADVPQIKKVRGELLRL
jgi:ATP-dependent exoDNAse (exonuclease V) beta subunit